VKANVLFFDRKPPSENPWTQKLWIYDFRTNQNFTLKTRALIRADLDDFVACYNPANRHERAETERFRAFTYDELVARDKASLDIFWLRDESLEDTGNLPAPELIAAEIVEDLQAALDEARLTGMSKLTPTQEAEYALNFGLDRADLKPEVQAEYDRLVAEGRKVIMAEPVDPLAGITQRTSPEVRARILAMIKKGNGKYAKPFDKDRLAAVSLIGTESWADYGQVVLQMAILDTLLSIEEKLDRLAGGKPGEGGTPG